jgi:hypothetical protein
MNLTMIAFEAQADIYLATPQDLFFSTSLLPVFSSRLRLIKDLK